MLLVGALAAGSIAAWVQMNPTKDIPEAERRVARLPEHQESRPKPKPRETTSEVEVLKPRYEGNDLKYDRAKATVPQGEDKMVFAVNQYLKDLKMIPAGAKATKATMKSGDLTLDFNTAFDHTYGSEDERTIVDGILRTLGQFAEINSVRFTIEGQQMETLGHLDLTTPQAVLRD